MRDYDQPLTLLAIRSHSRLLTATARRLLDSFRFSVVTKVELRAGNRFWEAVKQDEQVIKGIEASLKTDHKPSSHLITYNEFHSINLFQ